MNGKSVALFVALVLAFVDVGTCIKCYHCNSQSDSKCAVSLTSAIQPLDCESVNSKEYNNQYLNPLLPAEQFRGIDGEPKYCHKLVLESGTVFRTCLDGRRGDKEATCKSILEGTKNSKPGYKVKQCFQCDKDGCNGAGSLTISLPLSLVAFFVTYLLYKQ